jgi:glycine/D-amino acid oxidase-like deaminating enzyme
MADRRVVIIGGGLAGMIVAKELLQRGMRVVIFEADERLGGKAGGDLVDGVFEEHGYHVFPGWYVNIRQLLRELHVDNHLIDITQFWVLRKQQFPHFLRFRQFSPAINAVRNVFSGILPWPELLMTFYFVTELAAESFNRRWFLDRVSVNGFLRSRPYATEGMATFQQQTVLQASSIPNYELSAMASQKIARAWMATRAPLFSILDSNLDETFIQPFAQLLRGLGADIRLRTCVQRLQTASGKVTGIILEDGSRLEEVGAEDIVVLATPQEVTLSFVDQALYAAEEQAADDDLPRLADIVHLVGAPMAALHLYLNRRVPDIPREHVNLQGSRYGLTFVDISQHWQGLPHTTLSMIASNFEPLRALPEAQMAQYLIEELQEFIPAIRSADIDRYSMLPNLHDPLFLNTIGAWPYRPRTRTRLANLYTAGDYCQSEADLTTMESAAGSALATARDILEDAGLGAHPGPLPLKLYSSWQSRLFKYAAFPLILPFAAWFTLRRQMTELSRWLRGE